MNGVTVYAYYTREDETVQVRISVDEADRLGLVDGLRVRLALPGQEAANLLVMMATRTPPFVWLQLRPLASWCH
jgi:hypothetical protein